jgi:hypothetical protein
VRRVHVRRHRHRYRALTSASTGRGATTSSTVAP